MAAPNPWGTAPATPTSSTGAPLLDVAARVGTSLQQPHKNIGDILDYQRAALAEYLFGKGNSDDNRAALRHAIGLDPKGFLASLPMGMGGAYADAPLPIQGLVDVALDTVTDPLTYETMGDSAIVKLLGKGIAGTGRALSHVTPAVIRNAAMAGAKAAKPAIDAVKNVARAGGELLSNAVNYGAEAARTVGTRAKNVAVAAKATGNAYAEEIGRRLAAINKSIMQDLTPEQTTLVQQLQHGEIALKDVDDAAVKAAYTARKKLTDDIARLQAAPNSEGLKTITGQRFVTGQPKVEQTGFKFSQHHGQDWLTSNDEKSWASLDTSEGTPRITSIYVDPANRSGDAARKLSSAVNDRLYAQGFKTFESEPIDERVLAATIRVWGKPTNMTVDEAMRAIKSGSPPTLKFNLKTPKLPLPREDRWIAYGARGPDPKFAGYEPDPNVVPSPFRTDYAGRVLEEIEGQPILRRPKFVKGAFGKMVPNPAFRATPRNLRVTHMAAQSRIPLNPILQEFEGVPGEMVRKNYRPNYFPGTHVTTPDPNAAAKTIQPLEIPNEHLKHQEPFTITPEKVDDWEKAFAGMLANSARTLGKNKTVQLLHNEFGKNIPGAITDLMEDQIRGRGTGRSNKEIVEDAWKGVLNLPKIAIVGTSPAHMANILSLLLAHAPEAVPGMLKHFGELATTWKRDPEAAAAARWRVLKPWIDKGVGEAFGDATGYWTTHIPGIKQMNRATWDLDMAAVMALADHYERSGIAKGADAAMRARQALVDYANKSPLTKGASWVAPFASFATESVKSVLGGILKRPATNEAINRLSGGRYLGGGDRSSGTAYVPTAKVGRAISDVPSLVRSDLGLPVRQAVDALPGVGKHTNNYLTYGEAPNLNWALQEVGQPLPFSRDVLENAGLSNFKPPNPWLEAIEDATRVKLPDTLAPNWSVPPAAKATAPPKASASGGVVNPWQ